MGDWCITIRGTGPHHNKGGQNSDDVDGMAKQLVGQLKVAGHTIHDAAMVFGGREEMLEVKGVGTNELDLAKRMFDAYNAQGPNPGKTYDGKSVPPWESLGDQVQGKWIAAARKALFG